MDAEPLVSETMAAYSGGWARSKATMATWREWQRPDCSMAHGQIRGRRETLRPNPAALSQRRARRSQAALVAWKWTCHVHFRPGPLGTGVRPVARS